MSIEKDIQQKAAFRNEHHKAVVNIIYSSNWLHEKVKLLLDTEDITNQQYNILRILRGSKHPLSTLQLRERMLDKMSDTSRIVDRMVKKDLVQKTTRASDKRLVDVVVTEIGLALLERLDQKNYLIDDILDGLTESEAIILNELLDKMRENHTVLNVD